MKKTVIVGSQASGKSTLAEQMCKGKVATRVSEYNKSKLTPGAIHPKTKALVIDEPAKDQLEHLRNLLSLKSILLKASRVDKGVEISPEIIITTSIFNADDFSDIKDVQIIDLNTDKGVKAKRAKGTSKPAAPKKAAAKKVTKGSTKRTRK